MMARGTRETGVRPLAVAAVTAALLAFLLAVWTPLRGGASSDSREARVSVRLHHGRFKFVEIERSEGGSYRIVVPGEGGEESFEPGEFAAELYRNGNLRWWQRVLNVSSPAGVIWFALGIAGQLLFASRMIVQWLASEREKRSVVPVAFWWLSLSGASMLFLYFVWRRDMVGMIGQGTGWLIYSRNLYLIYRVHVDKPVMG